MTSTGDYSYNASVKSRLSDELVNTYLMRPLAGQVVRFLYPTRVTPNQLTIASTAAGCIAAAFYLAQQPALTAAAGLFVSLKDLLDSADGQLARAKELYSRVGRFLDSIGDFVVNLVVFAAMGAVLAKQTGSVWMWLLASAGFLGISLRVSYHVFYQTSFLHLLESYTTNRTTEEVKEEDLRGDPRALCLQRIFLVLYGWQDSLVVALDRWSSSGRLHSGHQLEKWYADRMGLYLSGLIGMGTELFVLMAFSLFNQLEAYLWWNTTVMNGVCLASVFYRRFKLRRAVR
jgi:phosphatidylglycerophosphate synthase